MTVRELIAELRGLDPDAEVRFLHFSVVKEDGSGRVESYPVLDVAHAGDGAVDLSDFLTEGAVVYRVREVDWHEQPALKGLEPEAEADDEPAPAEMPTEPVDTLLVGPPFTRTEWSGLAISDLGREDSPVGRRVAEYLRRYEKAVMGSNRLPELMAAAGLPVESQRPMTEGLLRKALWRLVERGDTTVHGMEVVMAAANFARFLHSQGAFPLGKTTLGWLERAETLALGVLILAVNRHFGITPR
jgi:hypothetical protein